MSLMAGDGTPVPAYAEPTRVIFSLIGCVRLWRIVMACGLAMLAVWCAPLSAQGAVHGTVIVTHVDGRHGDYSVSLAVRLADGRTLNVPTRGVPMEDVLAVASRPVRLTVSTTQRTVALRQVAAGLTSTRPVPVASAIASSLAEPRFLIIPCQFSGNAAVNRTFVQAAFASTFPGANLLISQSSRGVTSLGTTALAPSVTMAQPSSVFFQGLTNLVGTGYSNSTDRDVGLANACMDALVAAGTAVNLADYEGVVVQLNMPLYAAWAVPATVITRNGQSYTKRLFIAPTWADAGVYAHEIGHTYGLQHDRTRAGYHYSSNWTTMSNHRAWTLGDHMYGALYDGVDRTIAGWNAARVRRVTSGSTVTAHLTFPTVAPIANDADVVLVELPTISGTDSLFIEARTPAAGGYETAVPGEAVVMHIQSRGVPTVLDVDDTDDPNDAGAQWLVGETLTLPQQGVTVTIRSKDASGFTVEVTQRSGLHLLGDSVRRVHQGYALKDSVRAQGSTGTVTYSARALPAGLSFNASTKFITGTPAASGTAWLLVQDNTTRDSLAYRVEVNPTPWVGATTRTFTVGVQRTDTLGVFLATWRGYQEANLLGTPAAPPGMTVSTMSYDGDLQILLTGRPTSVGTYTVALPMQVSGVTVTTTFMVTVAAPPPLQITSDTLRLFQQGYVLADTLRSTGGAPGTRTWRVKSGTLPTGVTLTTSGIVTGSSDAVGDSRVEIEVRDTSSIATGVATAWMRLRVARSLTLVTTDSVRRAGTMGTVYADTVRASTVNGVTATWTATGLPRGLSLSASGVLSGSPDTTGTFRATARVSATYPARTLTLDLPLVITIAPPTFAVEALMDQLLLGGSALPSAAQRYLDQSGNANGRLDVGDVLKFLVRMGLVAPRASVVEAVDTLRALSRKSTP